MNNHIELITVQLNFLVIVQKKKLNFLVVVRTVLVRLHPSPVSLVSSLLELFLAVDLKTKQKNTNLGLIKFHCFVFVQRKNALHRISEH